METRVVYLVPGERRRGSNQAPRAVLLWHEDAGAWYGRPLHNRQCPAVAWPKHAWRLVDAGPPRRAA